MLFESEAFISTSATIFFTSTNQKAANSLLYQQQIKNVLALLFFRTNKYNRCR